MEEATRKTSLTGLLLLALVFILPVRVDAACALTRYAAVDITLMPGGGVLVPARIGQRDVWLALQLNQGMPMITPAAVAALGLPLLPVEERNRGFNGQPITRQTVVQSLVIGSADFAGWKMYVMPGPERPLQNVQGRPVVGALSSTFMNEVDVELDLAAGKMNLFEHSRCGDEVVYWTREFSESRLFTDQSGLLFFPMELEGQRIETSLNTGGPRSRLSETIARRFLDFDRKSPGVEPLPAAAGDNTPLVGVRRMSITAKEISQTGVPVFLLDDARRNCQPSKTGRESGALGFPRCFSFSPFEIGTDLLRQFRVYIASKDKRIYFTRVGAPPP